nr:MAG TPA: hypothetical protein [Caudoviricetes sp.]
MILQKNNRRAAPTAKKLPAVIMTAGFNILCQLMRRQC